jgi:N-methylhydantoinase A
VVEEVAQQPSRNPGTRQACFDADQRYVDTTVVQRSELAAGTQLRGQFGSTVPVHPGSDVRVDELLDLIVTRSEA